MTVGQLDLEIVQGSPLNRMFTFYIDGILLMDLTGFSAVFGIKRTCDDTVYLAKWDSNDTPSYITVDPLGRITLAVPYAICATLNFDVALYNLEIYSISLSERVLEGSITLNREVVNV